jgi:uncharacterized cupin superfamily protein
MSSAAVITPDLVAPIRDVLAYHTDESGQTFMTVILGDGDVTDVDALDVTVQAGDTADFDAHVLDALSLA